MTFTNKKNIDSENKIDITVIYLRLTFPMNVPKDKIKRTLEITNPKYWNNIEYKIKQSIVAEILINKFFVTFGQLFDFIESFSYNTVYIPNIKNINAIIVGTICGSISEDDWPNIKTGFSTSVGIL